MKHFTRFLTTTAKMILTTVATLQLGSTQALAAKPVAGALPTAQWSTVTLNVDEAAGTVTGRVTVSTAPRRSLSIPYTVSGTASNPGDHNIVMVGQVTIPGGATEGTLQFNIVNDTAFELAETIVITLGDQSRGKASYTLGANTTLTVNIADNDTAPVAQFRTETQRIAENISNSTVVVDLNVASGLDVTIPYTVAGTATLVADHSLNNGTLRIPAGATSGNLTFQVVDDNLFEGDETIIVNLGAPNNASLGARVVHTTTITDNETAPSLSFDLTEQAIAENAGAVSVRYTLSSALTTAVTARVTVSGTATSADHNLVNGSILLNPGDLTGEIRFNVINNDVFQGDKTVILTLSDVTGAVAGRNLVHTVTIRDDEVLVLPVVQWSSAVQTIQEDSGMAMITAGIDKVSAVAITVPYVVTGTSVRPDDHNLVNGTITIAAGALTASVPVTIVNDTLFESDETIIATLGTPTNATLGAASAHVATIVDNDAMPVVQLAAATQTVEETIGNVNIAVALSAASGRTSSVNYTVSGTSTRPEDHNLAAGTLNIPVGATTANITFAIVNDTLNEGDETVIVTLTTATGATLGTTVVHTVTVRDDDLNSTVAFAQATQNINENAGTVNIPVNLSTASAQAVTIPYTITGTSTSPADHNLVSGNLTIAAGSLTNNISVAVVDDNIFEGNETLIITLGTPSLATVMLGTNRVLTATIVDNETQPQATFALALQSVSEAVGMVSLTVNISAASSQAINLPYTVSGTATATTDHGLAAGILAFAAGETSKVINFTVVNDALFENNETVIITLGTAAGITLGTPAIHTTTITNDDTAPTVQFAVAAQNVQENAGNVTLAINLSAASGLPVEIPITAAGTATVTADYTAPSARVTVAAGATSVNISVGIVDDALNEDNENIVVTLGTPANATLGTNRTNTLTVTDNDAAPTVQWSVAAQNADENSGTATAVARLSAASGKQVTVAYTVGGNANNLAANRTKYTLAPGTITFAAGTTQMNLPVTLVNDSLAGPSDFTVILSLETPVNASMGAVAAHTITIIDNDVATPAGVEGYRTSVWPLVRARCNTCHTSSTFLPNHASDDLRLGYDAAFPRVNFADIPNSRMVVKSGDGHCGVPALCSVVTGAADETRPMMIAAIQRWAASETGTPPPPPPATLTSGTLGFRDAPNYVEFVAAAVGLSGSTYQYVAPYSDVILNMSQDGDVAAVSGPMLLAYTAVAAKVCEDFVNREKTFALNSTSRLAFGPIDFVTGTNIGTAVLSQANVDTTTNNLAKLFWRRDATAAEKTEFYTMVTGAIAGRALTNVDTSRIMTMACVTAATSLESLQY